MGKRLNGLAIIGFSWVCGGLGEYFNVDLNIIRVVWVLLASCLEVPDNSPFDFWPYNL